MARGALRRRGAREALTSVNFWRALYRVRARARLLASCPISIVPLRIPSTFPSLFLPLPSRHCPFSRTSAIRRFFFFFFSFSLSPLFTAANSSRRVVRKLSRAQGAPRRAIHNFTLVSYLAGGSARTYTHTHTHTHINTSHIGVYSV